MPYVIIEFKEIRGPKRFKLKKKQVGRPHYFSNNFMTYDDALKQMRAIILNEK